jgi:phage I-like protein
MTTGEAKTVTLRLMPLRAALPKSDGASKLPVRLKLLNWGRNDTAKGPVILSDASAEIFAANQRRLGRDRVAVDFEHNTVEGMPEYERSQEPRPVAGFGSPRLIPGDGLYLEATDTTPEGARALANFEDLSPAPWLADDGTLIALHSVALCRAGSVYDLTLTGAALAAMSASLSVPHQPIPKQTPMSEKVLTLTALAAMLSLPAEATEDQVSAKLKALSAPLTGPSLSHFEVRLTALGADVIALKEKSEINERAALVAEATRDGKVIPLSDEQIKLMPLSALREMVGKLEGKVVPLSAGGKPLPKSSGGDAGKSEAIRARAMQLFRENPNSGFDAAWKQAASEVK